MVPPTPMGLKGPSSQPRCPLAAGSAVSIYLGTSELSE